VAPCSQVGAPEIQAAIMRLKPSKRSALPLILFMAFCSVFALWAATAAAQAPRPSVESPPAGLTPEKLFQQVSPSVFLVEAVGPDGRILSQGSGVVVAHESMVTNRHVWNEPRVSASGGENKRGPPPLRTWIPSMTSSNFASPAL
jgi:hypothetical protein